jgi:hypothetical protein
MKRRLQNTDSEPPLTFDWEHTDRRGPVLFLGLSVAAAALVFVVMLFRVARIETTPIALKTHEVTYLEPGSPHAQHILARAAALSQPLLRTRGVDELEPQLASGAPLFQPRFKGFSYSLKSLPEPEAALPVANWFRPERAPLPSLPALPTVAMPGSVAKAPSHELKVKARFTKEQRPLAAPIMLPTDVSEQALASAFRVAVDQLGRVVFALPLQDRAEIFDDVEKLRKALTRMRFSRSGQSSMDWAEVRFVWEAQKAK